MLAKKKEKDVIDRMLNQSGNSWNGYTTKTVTTDDNDTIEIHVPRDRNNTFEPVIVSYVFDCKVGSIARQSLW